MNMIEKVARAIWHSNRTEIVRAHGVIMSTWDDLPDITKKAFLECAKGAIQAMRTPTDQMMEVGCASHPPGDYHSGTMLKDIIEAEWIAMVDEAINNG